MSAPTPELLSAASLAVAFTAAATGSLHCLGMCGPLRLLGGEAPAARVAYQGGRGLAYFLLGGLAGTIGAAVPAWALVLILAAGLALSVLDPSVFPAIARLRALLQGLAASSPWLLGAASGLLPCGLLHGWIAAAAATASPWRGALFLGMLWLGTLPAMELGMRALASPLTSLRRRFPRAMPLALLLLAMIPLAQRLSWTRDAGHAGGGKAGANAGAEALGETCHSRAGP